jgi:hypothetical protein
VNIYTRGFNFQFGTIQASTFYTYSPPNYLSGAGFINALADTAGHWVYVKDSVFTPVAALADNSFIAGGKRIEYGTWAATPLLQPELAKANMLFNTDEFGVLSAEHAGHAYRNMTLSYFKPDLSLQWKGGVTGCGQTPYFITRSKTDGSLTMGGSAMSTQSFTDRLHTESNGAFLAKVGPATITALQPAAPMGRSLHVWPVPATSRVQVETMVQVELLSLDGRPLAHARPVGGVAQFNLAALPLGTYIVRSGDGKVARILKQ